jgi:hypothetical protein
LKSRPRVRHWVSRVFRLWGFPMLKHVLAATAFAACLAAPAEAQDGTLPAVDTMNCEQMQAELMVAGQTMNSQLDPEFATEAQAMHDESQQAVAPSMVTGIGTGIACSIPGVAYACMAAQQSQAMAAQRQAAENQSRMNAQVDRLNASMAGLDQERLMALSQRFEDQGCETPQ